MMAHDVFLKRLREAHIRVPPSGRISRHHVAVFLGVSRNTLTKYRESGLLPGHKQGGNWVYDVDDLFEFMNR